MIIKKKIRTSRSKIAIRIAQTNGKSNCIIATNGKYRKHTEQAQGHKAKGSGSLLGEARARGDQEEALNGMQIRGGVAGAGIRRVSGGALDLARGSDRRGGVGAGVGGVRRLPRTLPFQPVTAAAAASAGVRLDWIGLDSLPSTLATPAAFPPSAPRLPFCSRSLFPLESRPPLLLASASARPKRVGWCSWRRWRLHPARCGRRVHGVGRPGAALRLAWFGQCGSPLGSLLLR
jgi:hypothetical protein